MVDTEAGITGTVAGHPTVRNVARASAGTLTPK
jgi:hypothetical protein